jgi:hypothetical protein
VTATVFGGAKDRNTSAYDGHLIDDQELGVALPFRFRGQRPRSNGVGERQDVTCPIVDVGPWNTNDPYWMTSRHPQAESGRDMTGRPTNGAGTDLTPAAAEAIGLNGKGQVVWFFDQTRVAPMSNGTTSTTTPPTGGTTTPAPQVDVFGQFLLQIKQQIDGLLKQGGAAPPTLPAGLPPLPALNATDIQNINKQLATFVQFASVILPILSPFVPQLKLLIPVLPVLTGLLQIGDSIAQAGNDPTKIADALTANLPLVARAQHPGRCQ